MTSSYNKNKEINAQGKSFKLYLKTFLNDDVLWGIIDKISTVSDVYIFSGVIRDFLTGDVGAVRDLDIVVSKRLPSNFFSIREMRQFQVNRNQFGGLKLKKDDLIIDIWYIEDTWGLKVLNLRTTPYSLIKTVFFNFSSIVYDYNHQRFIYDIYFDKFLSTREMDIVFPQNPNIPLCIVNIKYYAESYLYTLSSNVRKWLTSNFKKEYDFDAVQIRHFGKKLYELTEIEKFVNNNGTNVR